MIQPEDIAERFRELSAPQHPLPVAGNGLAGRVSTQWAVRGGATQIKCELCPQTDNSHCSLSCNAVRHLLDEKDNVKVKTFI